MEKLLTSGARVINVGQSRKTPAGMWSLNSAGVTILETATRMRKCFENSYAEWHTVQHDHKCKTYHRLSIFPGLRWELPSFVDGNDELRWFLSIHKGEILKTESPFKRLCPVAWGGYSEDQGRGAWPHVAQSVMCRASSVLTLKALGAASVRNILCIFGCRQGFWTLAWWTFGLGCVLVGGGWAGCLVGY